MSRRGRGRAAGPAQEAPLQRGDLQRDTQVDHCEFRFCEETWLNRMLCESLKMLRVLCGQILVRPCTTVVSFRSNLLRSCIAQRSQCPPSLTCVVFPISGALVGSAVDGHRAHRLHGHFHQGVCGAHAEQQPKQTCAQETHDAPPKSTSQEPGRWRHVSRALPSDWSFSHAVSGICFCCLKKSEQKHVLL